MRTLRLCAVLVLGLALGFALDDDAMAKLGSAVSESIESAFSGR